MKKGQTSYYRGEDYTGSSVQTAKQYKATKLHDTENDV